MEGIMIKDAASLLNVEAHVLRYWEVELGLEIKRNSMGHRYYDERDIKMFNNVKELKSRGLSLKDIRKGIEKQKKSEETEIKENQKSKTNNVDKEDMDKDDVNKDDEDKSENKPEPNNLDDVSDKDEISEVTEDIKVVDFKLAQMQKVMNKVIANALNENKTIITSSIKAEITEDVMRQFDTVMREKEEREEARFKKLDECLRQMQRANEEVAATRIKRKWGRRK